MTISKLWVPTLCVLLGCAGGAAMGSVTAQTWPEPANVRPWQQECIDISSRAPRARAQWLQDEVRARGEHGWELVGEVQNLICFKRPAN